MRTFKLTLAYDGTRHVGWQRQATGTSIQGLLESALSAIEGRPVTATGAGRTDAGVHALGQVASLALAHRLPPDALLRALNAHLLDDVRVRAVEEAGPGFHARFSAIGKTYRYRIRTGPTDDPFDHRFAWHIAHPLDLGEMRAAMAVLTGRHDFKAFQSAGSDVRTTIRTVTRAELRVAALPASWPVPMAEAAAGDVLEIEFDADGFLRQMVRAMVGTLVEVGAGRRAASSLADVLASGDRGQAGATAPPHGLFLVRVVYPAGASGHRGRGAKERTRERRDRNSTT